MTTYSIKNDYKQYLHGTEVRHLVVDKQNKVELPRRPKAVIVVVEDVLRLRKKERDNLY
jgi:hypothetical protein